MTCIDNSYVDLRRRLMANPSSTSVLPDSCLLKLARHPPVDPALNEPVAAELWLRRWLYVGDARERFAEAAKSVTPTGLADLLLRAFETTERVQDLLHEVSQAQQSEVGGSRLCAYLKQRLADFLRCNGLVALLAGHAGEAVGVPFLLMRPATSLTPFRDKDGAVVSSWAEESPVLWDVLRERLDVILLCSLGDAAARVEGRSFMLPVALAHAKLVGRCPDFPSRAVLASGALSHNHITQIEGLDAKAELARKLGAAFIAPECGPKERALTLHAGETYDDALQRAVVFLRDLRLTEMTAKQGAEGVLQLWEQVCAGTISLVEAESKLSQYEVFLDSAADDIWSSEGMTRALLLRGAIANHSGEAAEADRLLSEAAARCEGRGNPKAYVEAVAHRVVSLTDLGQYDQAEHHGRQLLRWVDTEFRGREPERAECRMIAYGTLGGQPLLFSALMDPSKGPESLDLLMQALKLALQLDYHRDVCRDAVQVALWHALLSPASYLQECLNAEALIARYPQEVAVSYGYLHRTRLLGAYRTCIKGGPLAEGFDAWPLPDVRIGHLGWVRGTALKYRGALLAAGQRIPESQASFDEALALLDAEDSPLIRFIAGTAALQAAESLHGYADISLYLSTAESVFRAFSDWFQGPISASAWLCRTMTVKQGGSALSGDSPQRAFPY